MSEKDLINKKNIAIVVLIVVALVLGFAIKNKGGDKAPVDTPSNGGGVSAGADQRDLSRLSDDERATMDIPYNGTDEEKQTHFDLAASLARESDALDLSGCLGSPLVMVVSVGSDLKVKNSDSVSHRLIFDQDTSFDIPAGKTETIKDVFSQGVGLYGYGCDQHAGVAGLFLVTQ